MKTKKQLREQKARLKAWEKFLKDDADYDWHYIIRTLRFKLERTRDHIVEHNIIKDAKKVGAEIQAVVDCLKRVEENTYGEDLHKAVEKKWGKLRMTKGTKNKDGSTTYSLKYEKETPENEKKIRKEILEVARQEEEARLSDLKTAFSLMEKNLWNWWD